LYRVEVWAKRERYYNALADYDQAIALDPEGFDIYT
jgi:hypothetical protein